SRESTDKAEQAGGASRPSLLHGSSGFGGSFGNGDNAGGDGDGDGNRKNNYNPIPEDKMDVEEEDNIKREEERRNSVMQVSYVNQTQSSADDVSSGERRASTAMTGAYLP